VSKGLLKPLTEVRRLGGNSSAITTRSFEHRGRKVKKNWQPVQRKASGLVFYHGCPGFIDLF